MIFFLINRFRRKKLRARESRQTAEDQRSIVGSIGYIAGNMGYMEGNLSSMDYTYGGAATHYPLWKPPSGYFPRGEAPPPYDEAVAISQAEALSAQCAAAAAAAQVAANQRATMGMNTVEMQNADMNRRAQATQQMQQIQHHAQPQTAHSQLNHQTAHVVPTLQTHVLAPQSQQSNQSHQITQSTTNLINININSGGNITTIATGENHQPPYSLQDENAPNGGLMQQQSSAMTNQQLQMQQQQQQLIAATTNGSNGQANGRVHIAQSNSICVQTMTPINQSTQQQQPQQQQMPANQSGLQSAQLMTANITGNNTNTLSRQTQNLVMNSNNDCGYKNCHLSSNNSTNTVSRRLQRNQEPLQQYVVDVEVNVGNNSNRGYHSLPPCNNSSTGELEVIASPTQFSNTSPSIANAISTPAIDQVSANQSTDANNTTNNLDNCTQFTNTGHNTLPLQLNQTNKSSASAGSSMKTTSSAINNNSSTSSSSKRYHRTMPRYYAVADPLSSREAVPTNALNTASKSSKTEVKLTTNNITNSSNNSSANSSLSSKKPTCQCPVQHVPMSYMGSTQLTNAQNVSNNAFFTVLSNKLSSSSSNNSPTSTQQQQQQQQQQQHSSQRLQTNSNTNSLNYQPRPKSSQSLSHTTRDGDNINLSGNNTIKRSLNSHCNYEPKIATISTGELQNSTSNAQSQHHQQQQQQQQQQHHHNHSHSHAHHHGHHSSLLPPPQHHDDSSPIVLGRVTKRSSSSSSGDRLRSASSGSTRCSVAESVGITSPAAAAYLNSKVDAYLNFAHGTNHHLKANDLINPALPPKLHKSLTNLKSTATSTTTLTASSGTSSSATNTNNHRKTHNNNDNAANINNSNTTSTNCNNFSSSMSSSSNATANTTSVQTIYTLSKPHHSSLSPANNTNTTTIIGLTPSSHAAAANLLHARKSEHDHIMKISQQQPPSLTLPLSTTSTISSFTSSTSKINSSTFYPLQNNVTYTLPKNIGGKMSLNSTINSVVSKVPSVISLPSSTAANDVLNSNNNYNNGGGGGGVENHNYHSSLHHHALNEAAAAISKSTTLPKILRTKRDLHNTNNSTHHNSSANNPTSSNNSSSTANSTNNTSTTSNYAVSQCSMPAYPKQYSSISSSSAANAAAATLSSSSQQQQQNQTTHSHSHTNSSPQSQQQQQQQQPTNINMQTQTITSTLAANYCPEDSHLNPHHLNGSNSTNTTNTTHSSNNSKQLPVCTTSKNCLNPKEHFLPNDTSLDDDYLSECENCKIAQSSKYYLDAEALASGPQETMTLQRKSMEECKEEPETGYYRISHTLPTNSKKNAPVKSNNREQWFSTIPAASSSSEEDINE
ncbi:hypothetical protein FF38_14245 [Lucilia cuprina]|uniref:Uncharacterized protein n=1 Tax=Lucilia cuprina TaxID=7375 RepID=A0A0L0BS21_LUCCU|nr:hypothetical protein FF38_14245 [Lucilia cuprina]